MGNPHCEPRRAKPAQPTRALPSIHTEGGTGTGIPSMLSPFWVSVQEVMDLVKVAGVVFPESAADPTKTKAAVPRPAVEMFSVLPHQLFASPLRLKGLNPVPTN